ncbi:conserved hypothetical protein [Leishmania infantum JPCM5]|uniref:Uncharacterized protein n=2 Tax=Leishmania infantum TaxID=5671 RepID=A4I2S9_LEIIN|nr:conserved hypothetical protein [Leishmania infantum JPCM5]CAC9499661.1 hypothetical_protein_-_conserved [Leishmania infantum]CAM69079.1 conserved hypothetical protein [Leishmania infantum JPCM5]SUZ43016.1 hypothetical_protein_-_conserved [Leishmania infantum]|eukprot:XP_001466362.1 conserved hypothetical protein [Leishmania infantum JPCM5]
MQSRVFYFPGKESKPDYEPRISRRVNEILRQSSPQARSRTSLQSNWQPYAPILSIHSQLRQEAESRSPSRANVKHPMRASSVSSLTPHGSQVVSPSRLRYVGAELTKRVSPSDLLRGASVTKFRQQSSSQCIWDSPRHPKASNTLPVNNESFSTVLPCSLHPLLQQALLLIESAEFEERFAFCQEEMDAFNSIITVLGVAKEVEVIRLAAFEMFHIERASRRALKRQERHERQILRLWYSESYEDALLSEEVRVIRQQSEESRSFFSNSLSRSRSTSLKQQSQDLFDMAAPRNGSPSSKKVPRLQKRDKIAHMASLLFSASRRQGEGIRGSSPTDNCDEVLHSSPRVLSPMPSEPYFSHTIGSSHLSHRSSDSVNVADRRRYYREYGDHCRRTLESMEADLEDRIARQEALLLPARQSYQSSSPFSLIRRQAPLLLPKSAED